MTEAKKENAAAHFNVYSIKKETALEIRNSNETDRVVIDKIHTLAFGEQKGPEITELVKGVIGSVKGKIQCSEVLDQPQHWRE